MNADAREAHEALVEYIAARLEVVAARFARPVVELVVAAGWTPPATEGHVHEFRSSTPDATPRCGCGEVEPEHVVAPATEGATVPWVVTIESCAEHGDDDVMYPEASEIVWAERRDAAADLVSRDYDTNLVSVRRAGPGDFSPTEGATVRAEVERPTVVYLCGSTRFYDEFQQAYYDLTMAGEIVLSVGFYPQHKAKGVHGEGIGHDSSEKVALDELHKRKIDLADYVYVLDIGGYIGDSTRSEIEYAHRVGVPVRYASGSAGSSNEGQTSPKFEVGPPAPSPSSVEARALSGEHVGRTVRLPDGTVGRVSRVPPPVWVNTEHGQRSLAPSDVVEIIQDGDPR